ncbi:anion permease, partial [Paraburkholderia sp. SIMBA_050]
SAPVTPKATLHWGLYLALAVLVAVLLIPTPEGLPVAGQRMLAILAFAVVVWITEAVTYETSAIMITSLMAGLIGFAPTVA